MSWFLASHLVSVFTGGGLLKLFFGNLVRDLRAVVAFLRAHSIWLTVSLILTACWGVDHLTEQRHAHKLETQLTKSENARKAAVEGRATDRRAYEKGQAEAAAANHAHVQQIETQQQKVTTDVETDYQRKLAALHSELRGQGSAPQGHSSGPGVSNLPDTSSGIDASSGVSLSDTDRLLAAENELQLDELISWVEQQQKANHPTPSGKAKDH